MSLKQWISNPMSFLSDPWKGVLWKILACACFATLNGIVRYLTGGTGGTEHPLSPYEIAFLQNLFGCFFMLPWLIKSGEYSFKSRWPALHGVRIISAVTGVIFIYFAFSQMPIAKAVALGLTGPIFTVIGARLYLRERIGLLRLTGIFLGVLGIFVVMRPDEVLLGADAGELGWVAALPLLSAIAFSVSKLIGRRLASQGESPRALATYLLLFMAPVALVPALFHWVMPTAFQWFLLVCLGGLASLAHFSMAKTYSLAEVTFVTPFGISRLIFTAIIGFVAFGELSDSEDLWIGAAVILISTICLSFEGKKRLRIPFKTPA